MCEFAISHFLFFFLLLNSLMHLLVCSSTTVQASYLKCQCIIATSHILTKHSLYTLSNNSHMIACVCVDSNDRSFLFIWRIAKCVVESTSVLCYLSNNNY